jgi:hypothetical protein
MTALIHVRAHANIMSVCCDRVTVTSQHIVVIWDDLYGGHALTYPLSQYRLAGTTY